MTDIVAHGGVILAVAIATFVVACLGTRALIPLLTRAAVLDRPNERSSHIVPTPRGGGIAVVAAIAVAWLALIAVGSLVRLPVAAVLVGALLLAAVSWRDDVSGLPATMRFAAQCIVVGAALGVLALIGAPLSPSWLPEWLGVAAIALLWLWFINLFNFMDGIDGLAGSEAAAIGIGLVLFTALGIGDERVLAALAAPIAAAALGFLVWNWSPARIFLGDVGSVPLGYLLGFLLLGVASEGYWKVALILPLYFLADATSTLLYRFARGEKVWQPHRGHFYQRATQRGLNHAAVVRRVIAANVLLIGLGWAAENGWGLAALAAAVAVVAALLASLAGLPPARHRPIPAAPSSIEEPRR